MMKSVAKEREEFLKLVARHEPDNGKSYDSWLEQKDGALIADCKAHTRFIESYQKCIHNCEAPMLGVSNTNTRLVESQGSRHYRYQVQWSEGEQTRICSFGRNSAHAKIFRDRLLKLGHIRIRKSLHFSRDISRNRDFYDIRAHNDRNIRFVHRVPRRVNEDGTKGMKAFVKRVRALRDANTYFDFDKNQWIMKRNSTLNWWKAR